MISAEEVGMWKGLEVTKELYKSLKNIRDDIEQQMLNEAVLLSDKCQVELAKLVGIREGIDIVLNLDVESVDEQTD